MHERVSNERYEDWAGTSGMDRPLTPEDVVSLRRAMQLLSGGPTPAAGPEAAIEAHDSNDAPLPEQPLSAQTRQDAQQRIAAMKAMLQKPA